MSRVVLQLALVAVLVALASGDASAYPQFQLSRDQTCTGCHISPAGGGLLTENGMAVAEATSQYGTSPEFMYGALKPNDAFAFGGDFRGMGGYLQTPQQYLLAFPMQADLYGNAHYKAFSLHVTLGYRPKAYANDPNPSPFSRLSNTLWSREHYAMWQSDEGSPTGLFVRVGRFMPVFGLRLAEHPVYTRRFGGTPLYGETYGVAVEYVHEKYEGHVTGFIKDPLIDPVQHADGAAAYGEYRVTSTASVGAEAMVEVSTDDKKFRGGVTGKYFMTKLDLLFQGELQVVDQRVNGPSGGGAPVQLVGYAMASKFFSKALLLDLGFGHYDENIRIKDLDRDCIDLNLHWFTTSHFEAILNGRAEFLALGKGGPTGAYVFLQAHYRL
ncbi:MAG: hypothetical protein JWO36_1520 [Myxococcales bacterium]|nr:hypothetical protein [Myxococcales bacterium]